MYEYFVYILCSNNKTTLYIGVTKHLKRRVLEHKSKQLEGFSKQYNCENLVFFERYNQIEHAIRREKQIKKWKRQWKDNLINELNPNWDDLASNW